MTLEEEICKKLMPVGAIYSSFTEVDVAKFFGFGIWKRTPQIPFATEFTYIRIE